MPFLPLALAGSAGIVCGKAVEPSAIGLSAAALLLAAGKTGKMSYLLAACVCTFAALAGWKDRAAESLAKARPGPQIVEVEGRVMSEPRLLDADRWTFELRVQRAAFEDWQGPLDVPVAVQWTGSPPQIGDSVRLVGTWQRLRGARNPQAFDMARWYALCGIFSQVRVVHSADAGLVEPGPGCSFRRFAAQARQWLIAALTTGLEPESPQAHLLVAMTLGDTRPLEESLLEDFRATGTFHLFSVSGLHVGMLGLLLWILMRAMRVPAWAAALLIIPMLFFYALATGWKPASVRAATMAAFVLAGLMTERPPTILNSLCAAAFFILLADTRQLFNPGFQLSFSVVFSLVLIAPPLEKQLRSLLGPDEFLPPKIFRWHERWRARIGKTLAPLAAVSLAAWMGSTPLTIGYFHMVSLVAVPANMLCVPIAFCVMAVAMLAVCTGFLLPWLGTIFNHANWALASVLLGVVPALASLPGAAILVGFPPLTPTLTVLDVGSGAAQVFEAQGRCWLIDAGPRREFSRTLRPFLRARGRGDLDGLILTHGDAAHLGAAGEVVREFPPRRLVMSAVEDRSPTRRALMEDWKARGIAPERVAAGQSLDVAPGWKARILFPPPDLVSAVADDKALVVALESASWRVLLLSDAGPGTESWLLHHVREELKSDFLIKGAHRGGVTPSGAFLEAVSPRVVVATHRNFPASEKIPQGLRDWLAARKIPLLSLDEQGAVILSLRKSEAKVEGYAGGARLILPARP